jgi:hypothetical protein
MRPYHEPGNDIPFSSWGAVIPPLGMVSLSPPNRLPCIFATGGGGGAAHYARGLGLTTAPEEPSGAWMITVAERARPLPRARTIKVSSLTLTSKFIVHVHGSRGCAQRAQDLYWFG